VFLVIKNVPTDKISVILFGRMWV